MALSFVDNQVQAMELGLQWGVGRPRGGVEANDFRKAINATGIPPRHVCALAGWFGGAVPASDLPFFNDGRTSLETACKREGYTTIDLGTAIAALNDVAPLLMALVYVKATGGQEASDASVQLNKAQATAKTRNDVADALDTASRAVADVIAHPSKLVTVIRDAAELVQSVQVSTLDLLFAFIPGGKWTVGAAAALVLVGGVLYIKVVMRL